MGRLTGTQAAGYRTESRTAPPAIVPQDYYTVFQKSILTLTVGQAFALYLSPERGALVHVGEHRAKVSRSVLARFERLFGAGREWNSLRKADVRAFARARLGEVGIATVRYEVELLKAVAYWLRHEEELPVRNPAKSYLWSKEWRGLWAQYRPNRPRYTRAEIRGLRRVAWDVDPRCGLMLDLVDELNCRHGHLLRAKRSDIDASCEPSPTPEVAPRGWIVIRAHAKKGGVHPAPFTLGAVASLNRAFTGHLAPLEARFRESAKDYPLFPSCLEPYRWRSGVRTMGQRELARKLIRVEKLAGVEHVEGRAFHGIRRRRTDEGVRAGLSEAEIKALGYWKTWQVPRGIYQEQDALWAIQKAREFRERTQDLDAEGIA